MDDQKETERDTAPRHVTELRAIEWELSDIVKRLAALSEQVHVLAEADMHETAEGSSSGFA